MGQFEDWQNARLKKGLQSQADTSNAIAGMTYSNNNGLGFLDTGFDGRTNGTLYKGAKGKTMVSGNLWDSEAGLSDYIAANDYQGYVNAGGKLDAAGFEKANMTPGMSGMDIANIGLGTLGTLGNLYGAYKNIEIAEDTLDNQRAQTDILRDEYQVKKDKYDDIKNFQTGLTSRMQ